VNFSSGWRISEELTSVEAVPRLNRIGVQDEWEAYIEDLEEEITEQIRELY
jgi:V/A-type H+-transporting ATPase subunit A